jgi:hypothetical protein
MGLNHSEKLEKCEPLSSSKFPHTAKKKNPNYPTVEGVIS